MYNTLFLSQVKEIIFLVSKSTNYIVLRKQPKKGVEIPKIKQRRLRDILTGRNRLLCMLAKYWKNGKFDSIRKYVTF